MRIPRSLGPGHAFVALGLVIAALAWVAAHSDSPAEGELRVRRAAPSQEPVPDRQMLRPPKPSPPDPAVATVAAAGDIACDPTHEFFNDGRGTAKWCRAADTRDLLRALDPDVVLALGDTQYDEGRYNAYLASYDKSWGRLLGRTRPAIGNHEYYVSSEANGYFSYFGDRAGPEGKGWYSYDLASWHVIALNSNCQLIECGPGSQQYAWLEADLAEHPTSCTLAYFHHPRFSSGPHGDDPSVTPLWKLLYAAGTEAIFVGHDHVYERFQPLTPAGVRDPATGIRQFTVGTGGAQLYPIEQVRSGSVTRNTRSFGVLEARLREGSYRWRFVPVDSGGYRDRGTAECHGPPG